jgi:hypothetical protein
MVLFGPAFDREVGSVLQVGPVRLFFWSTAIHRRFLSLAG